MELTQEQLDALNTLVQSLKDKKASDDYRAKAQERDQAIADAIASKQQQIDEAIIAVEINHQNNLANIALVYDGEIKTLYDAMPTSKPVDVVEPVKL